MVVNTVFFGTSPTPCMCRSKLQVFQLPKALALAEYLAWASAIRHTQPSIASYWTPPPISF